MPLAKMPNKSFNPLRVALAGARAACRSAARFVSDQRIGLYRKRVSRLLRRKVLGAAKWRQVIDDKCIEAQL